MCLSIPGRVEAIDGFIATVDFWGVKKQVNLMIVDEPVELGDYVLNHVGYAIRKIPPSEVKETLALYEELLAELEKEDLMAEDVRSELAAAKQRIEDDESPDTEAPKRG